MVDDVRRTQCGQRGELVGEHVERVDLQRATGRTRLGKVGEGAGGEIVDDIDGVALGDEAIDQVGTEEPGSTDDQDLHVASAGGRYSPDTLFAWQRPGHAGRARCRATLAPSPILPMITEFATTARASTTAPGRRTESVTFALAATTTPSATMLLVTTADASTRAPS